MDDISSNQVPIIGDQSSSVGGKMAQTVSSQTLNSQNINTPVSELSNQPTNLGVNNLTSDVRPPTSDISPASISLDSLNNPVTPPLDSPAGATSIAINTASSTPPTSLSEPTSVTPTQSVATVTPDQIKIETPSSDTMPVLPPPPDQSQPAVANISNDSSQQAGSISDINKTSANKMALDNASILPPAMVRKKSKLWIWLLLLILIFGGGAYYVFATESGMKLVGLNQEIDVPSAPPVSNLTTPSTPTVASPTAENLSTPQGRDSKRKSDLVKVQGYLSSYYSTNKAYPIAVTPVKLDDVNSVIVTSLTPSIVATLPDDPSSAQGWYYGYSSTDGQSYQLTSRIEDTTDTSGTLVGNFFIYTVSKTASEEVPLPLSTPVTTQAEPASPSSSSSTTSPTTNSESQTNSGGGTFTFSGT